MFLALCWGLKHIGAPHRRNNDQTVQGYINTVGGHKQQNTRSTYVGDTTPVRTNEIGPLKNNLIGKANFPELV